MAEFTWTAVRLLAQHRQCSSLLPHDRSLPRLTTGLLQGLYDCYHWSQPALASIVIGALSVLNEVLRVTIISSEKDLHNSLVVSLILSQKVLDDCPISFQAWADWSDLPASRLMKLERSYLRVLEWRVVPLTHGPGYRWWAGEAAAWRRRKLEAWMVVCRPSLWAGGIWATSPTAIPLPSKNEVPPRRQLASCLHRLLDSPMMLSLPKGFKGPEPIVQLVEEGSAIGS